jgi:hypothetical protein
MSSNAHSFGGKFLGNHPYGRPRRRWKDTTQISSKDTGCDDRRQMEKE